ncbi:MAG: EcoRV family type II restriction endonuclease [Verrucomicrobia bacterium]|nr:EcoRV family type II restriction endonuclease [Verrucomicrobiota bacterium]
MKSFVGGLTQHVSTDDNQWTVKGFIDVYKNVYTISADTKIVSKILEIHLFPKILEFAKTNGFKLVLTDHQNYYPDISFVSEARPELKFALDLKTTYRSEDKPEFCNGFTLGSHGEYFINRTSRKNIQFPYAEYAGHFCLGTIYTRALTEKLVETRVRQISELRPIVSVVRDFQFFVCEKWEIASDRSGSGNTANIGSITKIEDILNGNGMFKNLGEKWFDDYWMNYGKITLPETGKKITKLADYLAYRGQDTKLLNPRAKTTRRKT